MALFNIGVLLVALAAVGSGVLGQRPKVNIPGVGMVLGTNSRSTLHNREFHNFRGVQFGKPPSGDLRFKASVMAEPWKGVKTARLWGRLCPQTGAFRSLSDEEQPPNYWRRFHKFMTGEDMTPAQDPKADENVEDCLYTHIYTPTLNTSAKLPVMVFYHGGSFENGDARPYFPTHFMDYDVVFVVPHYRLGPIGFISMQNSKVPGNAGMLDQVLALEWIRDHIHHFGGDKDQVTAFGESAGAASVSLLAVSPLTKGLIKGIIAQSGAALAEWAIDREPAFNAREISKILECDQTDDDTISDCLVGMDVLTLLRAYKTHRDRERLLGKSGFGGCSPVAQAPGTGRIFMDRDPALYWEDPEFEPVPAIYGANKHEGTYVLTIVYDDYMRPLGLLNDTEFLTHNMMDPFFGMFGVHDTGHLVSDALQYEYVGIERMGNFTAMAPGLIDFSGATFLKAPGYRSTINHARTTNSYWYAFNFFGPITIAVGNGVVGNEYPFPPGVCHAAEVAYLFGIPGVYTAMNKDETLICRQMVRMWYNFAKYGNPVAPENPVEGEVQWPPYDPENEFYLSIDRAMEVRQDYTKEYTIAKDQNFGLNGTKT